eukprot:c23130_g3_i2 orf=263-508(+)
MLSLLAHRLQVLLQFLCLIKHSCRSGASPLKLQTVPKYINNIFVYIYICVCVIRSTHSNPLSIVGPSLYSWWTHSLSLSIY